MKRLLTALFATTLALLMPTQAAQALECGDVITTDLTLTADLSGCVGDGLVVAASGVTIDLAGHTISGGQRERTAGIRLVDVRDVNVMGGTVASFDVGVYMNTATNVNVEAMLIQGNRTDGVQVFYGAQVTLFDSDLLNNGRDGAVLQNSQGKVVRCVATSNGQNGFNSIGGQITFWRDTSQANFNGFNAIPYPGQAGASVRFRMNEALDNRSYGYSFGSLDVADAGGNDAAGNATACGPGACPLAL